MDQPDAMEHVEGVMAQQNVGHNTVDSGKPYARVHAVSGAAEAKSTSVSDDIDFETHQVRHADKGKVLTEYVIVQDHIDPLVVDDEASHIDDTGRSDEEISGWHGSERISRETSIRRELDGEEEDDFVDIHKQQKSKTLWIFVSSRRAKKSPLNHQGLSVIQHMRTC